MNLTYFKVLDWLQQHSLPCFFKSMFGIECPGCGFQRSAFALLKGNFTESFNYYHLTIPVLLLFIFTGAHLKFKFKNGNTVIQYSYIFIAALIATDFILKKLILK